MSDTINKQKILDDVVAVSSNVNMGVLYGAQNVTSQVFKAISATPSCVQCRGSFNRDNFGQAANDTNNDDTENRHPKPYNRRRAYKLRCH